MINFHRKELAARRLKSILSRHDVACNRTLEQKISDAGPNNQRIDPHVLNEVRNDLVARGDIVQINKSGIPWFHLPETPAETVQRRLGLQLEIHQALQARDRSNRIGQCLEISVYKALKEQSTLEYFGHFRDLSIHCDGEMYSKEEPPNAMNGRCLSGNQRLDFLVRSPEAGWAGIEIKNLRTWFYPDDHKIKDLLLKSIELDCVPVLIARRIQYSTYSVLNRCGLVLHENYNQLIPEADRELAEKAKHKDLLGYHDIRIGNDPDTRLLKFVGIDLPKILPGARERFDDYKDLLGLFARREIGYSEFVGRSKGR